MEDLDDILRCVPVSDLEEYIKRRRRAEMQAQMKLVQDAQVLLCARYARMTLTNAVIEILRDAKKPVRISVFERMLPLQGREIIRAHLCLMRDRGRVICMGYSRSADSLWSLPAQ